MHSNWEVTALNRFMIVNAKRSDGGIFGEAGGITHKQLKFSFAFRFAGVATNPFLVEFIFLGTSISAVFKSFKRDDINFARTHILKDLEFICD